MKNFLKNLLNGSEPPERMEKPLRCFHPLTEMSNLMRTQNNRGTQYPLFIIQEMQDIITGEDRGDRVIYFNSGDQKDITIEQFEALEQAQEDDCSDEEIEQLLEEVGMDGLGDFDSSEWERLEVKQEWVHRDDAGVFFTEKACNDHIAANSHHYRIVRSYVISAWRNPEMQEVMKMILKLTGDEIPSHYQ
jgi:hypothetical protein